MPTQQEKDLDAQFAASLKGNPNVTAVQANTGSAPETTGIMGATGRGALNGLLMGFQPQVAGAVSAVNPWSGQSYSQARDQATSLNNQAYSSNPIAYGAGYAGGTLLPILASGGATALGVLGEGGAAATAATRAALESGKSVEAAKLLGQIAGREAAPVSSMMGTAGGRMAGVGGVSGTMNTISGKLNPQQPQSAIPPAPAAGTPISMTNPEDNKAMQTASSVGNPSNDESAPSPFSMLVNYLAQAKNSNNTSVIALADQAKNASDTGNTLPIAMALNSTPTGRAVSNSESPLNEEDDQNYTG